MLTHDDLAAIEARADTTMPPGPWAPRGVYLGVLWKAENADFITYARADIRALLAEVRRLQSVERDRYA